MIIIKLTYIKPITEVDKYLSTHREFLEYHYKQGLLLASGPLKPRTGGIVIALSADIEHVKAIMAEDPFMLAEIAEYEFIEFTPVKHCAELKTIIQNAEGKLC